GVGRRSGREQTEGAGRRSRRDRARRRQAVLREGRVSELAVIPLARIRPNLNQVRRTFHRIDELARSIAQYGLLQNLVVRPPPAMIPARNLAPAVVVRLSQRPGNTVPVQRLLRLSALVDDESEPDEASQLRLFKQMLASPTRRGRRAAQPRTQKEMVWQRFQR